MDASALEQHFQSAGGDGGLGDMGLGDSGDDQSSMQVDSSLPQFDGMGDEDEEEEGHEDAMDVAAGQPTEETEHQPPAQLDAGELEHLDNADALVEGFQSDQMDPLLEDFHPVQEHADPSEELGQEAVERLQSEGILMPAEGEGAEEPEGHYAGDDAAILLQVCVC